jgi:hypothetical protein
MKEYNVFDFVDGHMSVVTLSDAEAEIEKAYLNGLNKRDAGRDLDIAKARADERERMVNTVSHWWTAKGWDPSCFTMLTDFIRSHGKPQEPKPLERLPTIVHSLGQEHEACVVDKINSLIDAFNDLQEWLRK